ncbi:putative ATPase AAA-type core domain-containing protein [Candidatus Magnetomoraceae bacterium gMMP-15]
MIKVNKDYEDAPAILKSANVTKLIDRALTTEKSEREFRSIIFTHPTVKERLHRIYNNKCAYCESKVINYSEIDHYRPKKYYYWLAYEWSNLLLVCKKCNMFKLNKFPIIDEQQRVLSPQKQKNEWVADSKSFLAEKPLLLNPEIDNPEDYLAFYPDGRIYAIDGNIRGNTTIDILNLNREDLILSRKKLVNEYLELFEANFTEFSELYKNIERNKVNSLLKLAFETTFNNLLNQTKPEAEYALLGRCMVKNFNLFFKNSIKNAMHQKLIQKALGNFILKNATKNQQLIQKPIELKSTLKKIIITRLKIRNIKCFDDVDIEIDTNSTLILGINGRGKSTILQLLALGLSGLDKPPVINDWRNVIKTGNDEAYFEIQLNIEDETYNLKFTIDENDKIKCIANADKFKLIKNSILILAYGTDRNVERGDEPKNKDFDGIASLFSVNTSLKHIRDSNTYNYVKAGFEQIKKVINKIFELADSNHQVELVDFDTDSFYFRTPTTPENPIPLEAMSDGFKSLFVWLFDMIIRAWEKGVDLNDNKNITGIVMIDEIDNHLHPGWQRTLLPALEKIFPNIQFIITSHSPFTVQSMQTNNIILLSSKDEGVDAKIMPLDGKPYGYEIEKIIELAMGIESNIPEISDWLFEQLKEFEKAVERADKPSVTELYKKIKDVIPKDSSFNEYLEIVAAGLLINEEL